MLQARIAREQGIFHHKHITAIQRWALSYVMWAERNFQDEQEEERVKAAMIINNPDLYRKVYAEEGPADDDGSGDETWGLDEIDDLEEFFKSLNFEQTVTAEATEGDWI